MRIGPFALPSAVVLAPMAGVTDRPFRVLCRRLGAGLAAAEMLTSDTRLWSTRKSRLRLDHRGEPEPRVVQLAGSEPLALASAARASVALGAQIIDINMGCPAKKVCGRLCGSALLRDEPQVGRILDAVVHAVSVPVTLKIRTGWDPGSRNGVRIAQLAERCGVQALAVHGRTRADFYGGAAEYETIRDIKAAVGIPVLANGDIDTPQKARAVLAFTRADGVMLGRGAHGRPWIFSAVNAALDPGANCVTLAQWEVRAIIRAHLESLYAFYGEDAGVRIARKHLGWYCDELSAPAAARAALMAAGNTVTQFASTMHYLDRWVEGAG
jgi:tRNA-dihydrouridine synthase B